jgi:hypothetical protein
MKHWMNRRHKWYSPWWSTHFTCGRTCNASAEANNAALKVAYEVGSDTIRRLVMQTCERSCALRAQDLNSSDANYLQSCSASSSLSECDPLSLAGQIHDCRAHFATHVGNSLERTIARFTYTHLPRTDIRRALGPHDQDLPLTLVTCYLRCNDYVALETGQNTYPVTWTGSLAAPVPGKTQFIVSLDPVSSRYMCTAGCGKSIYKGKACVHVTKVACLDSVYLSLSTL